MEEKGIESEKLNGRAHTSVARSSFNLIALTMKGDYTLRRLRLHR